MTIGFVSDEVTDVQLQYIADNGDKLVLCNALPTTYAEAVTTYALASISGLTSGDYTLANGDVSGRKLTLAAQTGLTVAVKGLTSVAAIVDTLNSKLLLYAPCNNVTLYVGNTTNTTALEYEILDVA